MLPEGGRYRGLELADVLEVEAGVLVEKVYEGASRDELVGNEWLAAYDVVLVL